jgi:hypothetical protein
LILTGIASKYVWNLEVYVDLEIKRRGGMYGQVGHPMEMAFGAVTMLTEQMDDMHYRLAMDLFFTSVRVFDHLHQQSLYTIGTIRQPCPGCPSSLNVIGREPQGIL